MIRRYTIRDGGSMAGAVHRGWMSLREAVSTDKVASLLAAADGGEDHAGREYDNALSEPLPIDVRAVISRQASDIRSRQQRLRTLRETAPKWVS